MPSESEQAEHRRHLPSAATATIFVVTTTETATTEYTVSASSYDEAREKIGRGEYDGWRDLGHDDVEIIDVKLAAGEWPEVKRA